MQMGSDFARLHFLRAPTDHLIIDHTPQEGCVADQLRIQGAYNITLDNAQLNELVSNSYTFTEATCLLCNKQQAFLLKVTKTHF